MPIRRASVYVTETFNMSYNLFSNIVTKDVLSDGRAITRIAQITGDARVREIARMLSGDTGEVTLMHARSLLQSSVL